MILYSAELAQIRADVLSMLPDACNILSVTLTSDGAGGNAETWGTATAGVSCRLDYKTGDETISGGAVKPFSGWVLTLPHDADIDTENRVEVGGGTYAVLGVDGGKSWTASIRCRLEVVT
jgi:hypothetical protein